MKPFSDESVAAVFESYPAGTRKSLLTIRKLIFDTAKRTPGVGNITETLKWGQPSYLTTETKSGSIIRIDTLKLKPGSFAIYVHCQTTLIDSFKARFGDAFNYDGNRAIIFSETQCIPEEKVSECIALALTYHLAKRHKRVPIGRLINKTKG
jgi:hypothetical protein